MASSTIKGITVKLGGDTKDLQGQFAKLENNSKSIQRELNLVNKELKFNPDSAILLAQKQELLEEKITNSRKALQKLDEIRDEVEQKAKSGDLGAEEYRAYQREVESTKSILEHFETELQNTGDKFKEVQRKSGEVSFSSAEDEVDHLKGKFKELADDAVDNLNTISEKSGKIGEALESAGNTLSSGSTKAAEVLSNSIEAFEDLDNGYDIIVKKTGATDEALESLTQTADDIFGSNIFDMTDIGNAVGEVNTRFGYTDEKLKSVSEAYLQFASINDTDVSNSVAKSARIMESWNVSAESLPDLLGMITAKGQETGISVDTLMDSVLTNNSTFKEMGLTLEESIGLMAQFEKNGVDSSTALAALKAAVKNSVKDGQSLSEALQQNVSDIKNASTETEALQEATKLFGSKGAAEMANSIRDGRINFDDLSGSMTDYKDTVKKTYEGTLDPIDESKVAINNLKLVGTELASVAMKEGEPLIEDVVNGIKGVTEWFKKLTPEEKKVLTKAIEIVAVAGPAVTIGGKITKGISNIASTATKLIPKLVGATAAQEGLNVAQNSNPIGVYIIAITALVAAISGLKAAVNEANQQQLDDLGFTEQADKMQEAVEKVSNLKDEVVGMADEIKSSMSDTASDLGTIDEYKNRLDELLDKANLSDAEQAELMTIGDYFSEKYPDFEDVWKNYKKVDDDGKEKLTGDVKEIKGELDTLIEKYKKVAASQALSNLSIEDTEAYVKAKQDTNEVAIEYVKAQNDLSDFKEKYSLDDEFIDLLKKSTANNGADANFYAAAIYAKYKEAGIDTRDISTENLYSQYTKLKEGVDSISGSFDEMVSKTAELKKNSEEYNQMQAVLNGSYENASAVLTSYYNNLITKEDIEKSKWGSLENLRSKAKETAEETDKSEAYTKQIIDESTDYAKFKLGMIEDTTGEAVKNTGDKMGELPNAVEGSMKDSTQKIKEQRPEMKSAMGGVADLGVKEYSLTMDKGKSEVEKSATKIGNTTKNSIGKISLLGTGKNLVSGFINGLKDGTLLSNVGKAAVNIGSTALSGIKNFLGIKSPSREAKKLGSFFGQGFIDGINDNQSAVDLASQNLAKSAKKGLETARLDAAFAQIDKMSSGKLPTFDLSSAYASLRRMSTASSASSTRKTISNITNSNNNNARVNVTINAADVGSTDNAEELAEKLAGIIIREGMTWG